MRCAFFAGIPDVAEPRLIDVVEATFTEGDDHTELLIPLDVLMGLYLDFYETGELTLSSLVYDREDRVLEAGCGIGAVTVLVARMVEHIVALEAQWTYATIARVNLERNHIENVEVLNAALGIGDGKATFNVRRSPQCSSVMGATTISDAIKSTYEVEQMDVNRLIREHSINALHLDVEGGEVEILPHVDLRPLRKLVLEMHPNTIGSEEVVRLVGLVWDAGLEPAMIAGARQYPHGGHVLAFARSEAAEEIRAKTPIGDLAVIRGQEELEAEYG